AGGRGAAWLAKFEPGFDDLVEWSVRAGDVEAAAVAATRGRSRTLLDQLRMARVDPRRGLEGPQAEQLRRDEVALRQRLARLRAEAVLLPEEARKDEKVRKLFDDFEQAQKDFAEVSRQILNASPVYRRLAQPDFSATV